MRRRNNPVEQRLAQRTLLSEYFALSWWSLFLVGIAALALSSDDPSSRADVVRNQVLFAAWVLATCAPLVTGIVLLVRRFDVDRSPLSAQGWGYYPGRAPLVSGRFHTFPLAARKNPWVRNMAWTALDNRIVSSYTAWTTNKYRYSVEQVELPVVLPPMMVVFDDGYDKILTAFGAKDLKLESADFNDRWRVIARNTAAAHAVLHPRMMARLLEDDIKNMSISFDGGAVIAWWPGRTAVDEVPARLAVLMEIADLIPETVLAQYGSPRDPAWGKDVVVA